MYPLRASCLFLLLIFLSCNKGFDTDTSPKADFELFFEYLKKDYAYRDYHPFTMEELRQKYVSQIERSNTKNTLATILLEIQENELKDPHVSILSDEPYDISSVPQVIGSDREKIAPTFAEITVDTATDFYTSGVVTAHPHIGYLYIRAFNYDIGGSNSFAIEDGIKEIDTILQSLIAKEVTAMIVDMRSGAGGSNYVPRYIAQRFIDKTVTYMVEEYPVGDSFERKEWEISPSGIGFRDGKVVLISNGLTGSGGEFFVLAMLQRDQVTHIGSTSRGAAGNITEKDLSNGWNVQITNSRTEFTDGTQYFKVGITPPTIVKNDLDYGFSHESDALIQEAVGVLEATEGGVTNLR